MKRESTDRLTEELVADLSPVQRIPRLRSAFAVILAVWAALLGVVLGSSHAGASNPSFGALTRDTVYLASFLGLLVAAVGGAISALAAGVPGRERIELGGLTAAWVGLMAAAIACLSGVGASGLQLDGGLVGGDLANHSMCFNKGLYLSLLPAGVILSFLVRGWTAHPLRAASVALLASGALGVL
ncbi:MAG TPA: hypothetical protein VKA74_14305, partial [Myxococcota bacterium]|nr:hypothetical protein [Myxococcota bacterium]